MMRSLYSGVAGLKTHQTKMDVIGNNIANVNTTAYKSQSITFNELMYQTTKKASGASAATGVGGTNAGQIGLGVKVGAINTNITSQGATQTTNLPFDIAITGDAFFVVSNGMENFFTRAGSFYVDGAGNLAMTSTGYNVMGWQTDPTTGEIKKDTVSALRIMTEANMTYPPEATTKATITGIADKNDPDINSSKGKVMNLEFYDSLGYTYTARMSTHAINGDAGQFYVQLDDVLDSNGKSIGAEKLAQVSFGTTQTVDTATSYLMKNGVKAVGTITVADKNTPPTTIDAKVDKKYTVDGNGDFTDGETPPTVLSKAKLVTLYGADVLTNAESVSIDKNGGLTVTDATTKGTKTTALPSTATSNIGTVNITDGTTTVDVPVGSTFTVENGVITPAGIDAAQVEALYGIPLTDVRAFTIGADGTLTVTKKDVANSILLDYLPGNGKFARAGGNIDGLVTLGFSSSAATDMSNFQNITLDFSTTLQSNNNKKSTLGAERGGTGDEKGLGTGRKLGEMSEIVVQDDGKIYANYDNGQSRLLGQIATASFANASGLEKKGDNLYAASMNSGDFDGIGEDIKVGGGYMTSGVLEMSNVDLSSEFTEMITTQRGFQANSRIITVSDTLLEELTNLKR